MSIFHLSRRREIVFIGVLFTAALVVRVYAAWCFRHNLNLDAGVVALMAKHIAEGTAFPVFFYGQAHMGSLEALFSGLFCRLFGVSGFAVCLGTVFVSFWLVPIVYLWARDAAGRLAGYTALVFVIIGPGGFFHYNATPRGAYAAALTLGAFVLWYATRMATRWILERRHSGWDFFLLGVGAGLAWWNSQLTTAAILAAAILLLATMRLAALTWRLLPGVIGFLLGSAPFWLYNALNDWPSFAFTGTFGRVKLSDGLIWFFTERFASLMLPSDGPEWLRYVALVSYIALTMCAIVLLVRSARTRDYSMCITLSGIMLFTALFALIYASSHFAAIATPRYFLPMVAPIAVVLGVVVSQLAQRLPAPVAILPVLMLVASQLPVLTWALSFERSAQRTMEQVHDLGERLIEEEIDLVYASNVHRSWNFALRERVSFVDVRGDFYLPNAQRAELTDEIAILENYGSVDELIAADGGSMKSRATAGGSVQYAFVPPSQGHRLIPTNRWQAVSDEHGRDIFEALADTRLHTRRVSDRVPGEESITVTFTGPERVSGLRMTAPHSRGYPYRWSVHGRAPDGIWEVIHDRRPFTQWFWSGPRPYWGDLFYRMEVRFEPRTLDAVRVLHHPERNDYALSPHTLHVFAPADTPDQPESEALDDLLAELEQHSITRLYADRWAAAAVHRATGGRIATTLDPAIFSNHPIPKPDHVTVSSDTGLLVRREEADALRDTLVQRRLNRRETSVGPWILFHDWADEEAHATGLRWMGYGAARDDGRWAAVLWERANEHIRRADVSLDTAHLIERALNNNPHHYSARKALPDVWTALGDSERAVAAEAALRAVSEPAQPAPIRYANGLRFGGYTVDSMELFPGTTFRMTYHWTTPPDIEWRRYAVFVHFMREKQILFQDDGVLLEDIAPSLLTAQTGAPVVAVERFIPVPLDLEPGPAQVVIGLVERKYDHRLRPRTDLPERRRAVTLPGTFMVAPAGRRPD